MARGKEATFGADEVIVSKTDTKGRITYANDVFLRIAGYTEDEVLGKAHSVIRHPDMPRCVFKLLWDVIGGGSEIFAYVKNQTKDGGYYWVFAHVTPRFDSRGNIIGYHSNRRCPRREAIAKVEPLYNQLLQIERQNSDRKAGLDASTAALLQILGKAGLSYEQFVLGL